MYSHCHSILIRLFYLGLISSPICCASEIPFPKLQGKNGTLIDAQPLADYLAYISQWRNISLTYELAVPTMDERGLPVDAVFRSTLILGYEGTFRFEQHVLAQKGDPKVNRTIGYYNWFEVGSLIMANDNNNFYLFREKNARLLVYNHRKKDRDLFRNLNEITDGMRFSIPLIHAIDLLLPISDFADRSFPVWYLTRSPKDNWDIVSTALFTIASPDAGKVLLSWQSLIDDDLFTSFQMRKSSQLDDVYLPDFLEFKTTRKDKGGKINFERTDTVNYQYKYENASVNVNGVARLALIETITMNNDQFGRTRPMQLQWKLTDYKISPVPLPDSQFAVDYDQAREIIDYKTGLRIEP
jgi:hypothetical protein